MTRVKPEIPKFRGPGKGRGGASNPKGRQLLQNATSEVSALLGDMPRSRDMLIEALHLIQDYYRCLSSNHLVALADEFRLAIAEVYETATFYHHFDVLADEEASPPEITVRVCESLTCEMLGAKELLSSLNSILGNNARVLTAPCMGACDKAPAVAVGQNQIFHATPEKIEDAVANASVKATIPDHIDYDTYVSAGGYKTLRRCYDGKLSREQVISSLESSSLCGLGGAGFSTGRKWRIVRAFQPPGLWQ